MCFFMYTSDLPLLNDLSFFLSAIRLLGSIEKFVIRERLAFVSIFRDQIALVKATCALFDEHNFSQENISCWWQIFRRVHHFEILMISIHSKDLAAQCRKLKWILSLRDSYTHRISVAVFLDIGCYSHIFENFPKTPLKDYEYSRSTQSPHHI